MNALTPIAPRIPDMLTARRAAMRADLAAQHGTWLRTLHLLLHVPPTATTEERIALAVGLLAGTGLRITPAEEPAPL